MRYLNSLTLLVILLTGVFCLFGTTTAGILSGNLFNPDGETLEEMVLVAISYNNEDWITTNTENGSYRFEDIDGGWYIVHAMPIADETWLYPLYYPNNWTAMEAEWIEIPQDGETGDINFQFSYGGRISGAVTPAEGGEFEEYGVRAELFTDEEDMYDPIWQFGLQTPSDYLSNPLPAGNYFAKFSTEDPADMHVSCYYGGDWDYANAGFFSVNEQETTEDISIELPLGGGVSGAITGDNTPLGWSYVTAVLAGGSIWNQQMYYTWAIADENGNYTLYGIPEGQCYLQFMPSDEEYATEWYDGVYNRFMATPINVASGQITENINADLEKGFSLSGMIYDPDGNVPEMHSAGIELKDEFGSGYWLNMEWDDDGNWNSHEHYPPGIYTMQIVNTGMYSWAQTYLNGALFSWDADWTYLGSGANGVFNIQLQNSGNVVGTVTDPNGDPVQADVEINLYNGTHKFSDGYFENGHYEISAVPAGDYRISASLIIDSENGIENIWPTVCNGGALQVSMAEDFAVRADEETEINLQFIEGGILHANITNPGGGYIDMEAGNPGAVMLPVRDDGLVMWEIAFADNSDGPPFSSEEGVDMILPPGTYTLAGVPIYMSHGPVEAPNLRRTFYGGSFDLDNAQTFEVTEGGRVEIEFELSDEGYSITGRSITEQGVASEAYAMMTFLTDQDGFIATGWLPMYAPMGDGSFSLKSVPNGEYYLVTVNQEDGFAVSTWYPNIAEPGASVEYLNPPDNAQTVEVNNDDVDNVELVVQKSDHYTSAPRHEEAKVYPVGYQLTGVYPNPFNNIAHIMFTVPTFSDITLKLYDLQGREIQKLTSGKYSAGSHHVLLNASGLSGGVYFVKMQSGNWEATRKVVLVK